AFAALLKTNTLELPVILLTSTRSWALAAIGVTHMDAASTQVTITRNRRNLLDIFFPRKNRIETYRYTYHEFDALPNQKR
ncbi:MAG: hypothetical protein ABR530_05185, partial [Pyrinomonadaceae bacterium]